MYCPNCGLANDEGARFCANCGTTLSATATPGAPPPVNPAPAQFQQPGPYQPQPPMPAGNSLAKNIGIGCLIAIAIFLFFGLSCTRACFMHRRGYLVRHI